MLGLHGSSGRTQRTRPRWRSHRWPHHRRDQQQQRQFDRTTDRRPDQPRRGAHPHRQFPQRGQYRLPRPAPVLLDRYGTFDITLGFNTNCLVLESHPSHPRPYGGKSSWSYNSFAFGFLAEANQNGVIVRDDVEATGVHSVMAFNANPGATNTGVAITVGTSATDDSHIDGYLSWYGESTTPGAVAHKDINVGGIASLRGYGALVFNSFSAAFVAGTAVPYRVVFAGRVNCPSLGHYAESEIPFVTIGDPGRFGALGDSANYINIEEGGSGGWPQLVARGPSEHIGINIVAKGLGSVQANGVPVGYRADSPPSSATASGTPGQIAFDQSYLYICTGTNTWKRTAIAGW
jgi:hypothetical protein